MPRGPLASMPQPGTVEFREYDLPEPKPGALLVETVAAGVGGSDLHMWEDRHPLKAIVLGHEMVGRVIDATSRPVDSAGEALVPGDLVSSTYFAFCGHCRACSRGQTHLCENG